MYDTEFELFALALAKKTICPNLRPQTGPTGGGDAKVDSETFPVAEQLALAWIVGNGSDAANERWAFAFSAKKVWGAKVDSDIKKLAETNRGYKKAFFVSNQFMGIEFDFLHGKAQFDRVFAFVLFFGFHSDF